MPCFVFLITLAFPRLAIVLIFLLSNYLERAYNSILLIIAGFLFLPLTTLVYAWIVNNGHSVEGLYLIMIVISVVMDLGLLGHGEYSRRRRVK